MSMASDVVGVLDDLVNQFSDPMSFLRELIQNAIDAGSGEVDIRIEHDPGRGMMTVHVDDFGEGMDRSIIETKLTRLFSSGKDDDFTKIGRFGIGFVSVFAIGPQVVCVDTGRAGEYWRILFKPDRTYDLLSLDAPVEGTQIRIFKPSTAAEVVAFAQRAREVVSYWCKHVNVPIYVDGHQINEVFAIDSSCQVTYEEEGTRIVAGWVDEPQAQGGFFNRGLTLKDHEPSQWPHVAFKIDSRYLEHTLTRDQVLKDNHYDKAHALLERVVREELIGALLAQVQRSAAGDEVSGWMPQARMWTQWLKSWEPALGDIERRPLIPTMYGEPVSIKELRSRHARGEIMYTTARSMLTDSLQERAVICEVPACDRATFVELYQLLCGESPRSVSSIWTMVVTDQRDRAPGAERLKDEVRVLLKALGARVEHIHFVDVLANEESMMGVRVVVCPEALQEPVKWSDWPVMSREILMQSLRIGLLGGYALWDEALELVRGGEPEWAALLVVKVLLLQDEAGMSGKDEGIATAFMVDRRRDRQSRERR